MHACGLGKLIVGNISAVSLEGNIILENLACHLGLEI